jgi:hypothetical protein
MLAKNGAANSRIERVYIEVRPWKEQWYEAEEILDGKEKCLERFEARKFVLAVTLWVRRSAGNCERKQCASITGVN